MCETCAKKRIEVYDRALELGLESAIDTYKKLVEVTFPTVTYEEVCDGSYNLIRTMIDRGIVRDLPIEEIARVMVTQLEKFNDTMMKHMSKNESAN